jgi:hypothetical protein
MSGNIPTEIKGFLDVPHAAAGRIWNEHGLQLELGIFLRGKGLQVEFERPFTFQNTNCSTRKPKRELDILVRCDSGTTTAVEIKTPLAGRVPECMFDFLTDIHFVERLVEERHADNGLCLLVTDNHQFWKGNASGIYEGFRNKDFQVSGVINKPTGSVSSNIILRGTYSLGNWRQLGNTALMTGASYLVVEIC